MKKPFKLLFLLAFFALNISAFADPLKQTDALATDYSDKSVLSHNWWLNVGLAGSGVYHHNLYLGGYTSLNYMSDKTHLMTLRAISSSGAGNVFMTFDRNDSFKDFGLMYGLAHKKKYYFASIAAGLGYFQYETLKSCDFYGITGCHYKKHNTIGVPVETQLFLTPTPYVGVGVIGFGNINNKRPYAGAALALQIGNLW